MEAEYVIDKLEEHLEPVTAPSGLRIGVFNTWIDLILHRIGLGKPQLAYLLIICGLLACSKASVAPAPPPSTPTPAGHKVKYALFVNPHECELKGSYQDSAGRTIAVNLPVGLKYALDTFNSSIDTIYWEYPYNRFQANYQIKIGEMAVGKSAYIHITGCNQKEGIFGVAIARDTTIGGRTEYIVKKAVLFNSPPSGTAELSYIVAN